ncbi:MAG: hypothetical protein HYX53_00675 [Chloroflexi bacterium]|nr:hypothetical protein [Chloroflexota bacterium]
MVISNRLRVRALAVALIALIGGGAALFALGGSSGTTEARVSAPANNGIAADQTAPGPTLVWECFGIDYGADVKTAARLTTKNFGPDVVAIRKSTQMCETANKFRQVPPGAAPYPPALAEVVQCYKTERGQDPDDTVLLQTENFGIDKVQVRTAVMMCEGASKLRLDQPAGGGFTPLPTVPIVWQCFKIESRNAPNTGVVLVTNNFGPQKASVRIAALMCEQAQKQTAQGTVFGDFGDTVLECFRLADVAPVNVQAVLDTLNFQPNTVLIRRANLMCEPATKTPLIEIPGLDAAREDETP